MNQRDRLIHRVALAISWSQQHNYQQTNARDAATAAVDALLSGSAEGKATERALKVILADLEKSA